MAKFKLNPSFPNPPHHTHNPVTHSGWRKAYARLREREKSPLGVLGLHGKKSYLSSLLPGSLMLFYLDPSLQSSGDCRKGHTDSATAVIPC